VCPDRTYGNGTGGVENVGLTMSTLRQVVLMVVDVAEPVHDGPVAEQVAVRRSCFLMCADLVWVADGGFRLNPILPLAVLSMACEEDVRGLSYFARSPLVSN